MATRAEPLRLPRSIGGKLGVTAACLAAVVGWRGIDAWSAEHMFLINRSGSLPNWAYLVDRHGTPVRDGAVFFTPPPGPLVNAHFGEHPAPFGKIIYGMPGDVVRHVGSAVYVGDRLVARMKPFSRAGEPLAPGPTGRIPDNCYYAGSGHPEAQGQAPLFIVFASLSMPAESLKPLIRDTARAGGAVVFQGFPGNSMKTFQQGILRVVERGQDAANVGIDPRLFRAFHVQSVPTFVVASSDFDLCSGFQCETAPPAHDRLSGNVTVEYALETIAEGKGPGARVAGQALKHLREGQGS